MQSLVQHMATRAVEKNKVEDNKLPSRSRRAARAALMTRRVGHGRYNQL